MEHSLLLPQKHMQERLLHKITTKQQQCVGMAYSFTPQNHSQGEPLTTPNN